MSDQPANITLRLALDQAALNQSSAGVNALNKNLTDLKATTQDAGDSGDKAASTISQAMTDVSTNAADATKQVNDLNSALAATAQTADQVSKSSSGMGNLTGLRRTGSALTQLGLGDIGQPIQKIGDLGQVIKELGQVSDSAGPLIGNVVAQGTALGGSLGGVLAVAGPLVLAIGAIALALGAFNETIKTGEDALKSAIQANQDYYDKIASGLTDAQAKAALTKAQQQLPTYQNEVNQAQQNLTHGVNQYGFSANDNPTLLGLLPGVGDLQKNLADAQKKLDDTNNSIQTYTSLLDNGALAANNAAKNEQELQTIRDQNAEKSVAKAAQDAQLIASGTTKGVQDQIASIEAQKKALDALDLTQGISVDEHNKLTQQWTDLNNTEKDLTDNVLPLVKAREDEAQKVKDTQKALEDEAKALEQAKSKLATAGNDYEKSVTAVSDAQKKGADAIQKIEDDSNQARADLEQSYADKRVDIARKAVETAQDELTKLEQKQADLTTGLNRNLESDTVAAQNKIQDLQTNFARQQVSDTQDHLQKLQDIQRQAQQSDQDALLNRNFRQLFENKQQTSNAIDAENERYQTQEQQRITALNQQETDEATSAARQRQQRLVAYNQAEADAQLAYQRQVQQQDVTEQRQLQDAAIANQRSENALVTKANRELAIQQQSAKDQLALLEQTELDKLQILKNAQSATSAVMNSQSAGGTGPIQHVQPFAAGGRISAFQAAVVNEPGSSGNESFNGAQFPRSMGLFIPSQAGNVNPGGKRGSGTNITVNLTVNTNSTDKNLADLIHSTTIKAIKQVVA